MGTEGHFGAENSLTLKAGTLKKKKNRQNTTIKKSSKNLAKVTHLDE